MQPRGRRRDRSALAREDRLVALAVSLVALVPVTLAAHVGGEWHATVLLEQLLDRTLAPHAPERRALDLVPAREELESGVRPPGLGHGQPLPHRELACRPSQRTPRPRLGLVGLQEHELDAAPARALGEEPRGPHAGVVHHQQITWLEQPG